MELLLVNHCYDRVPTDPAFGELVWTDFGPALAEGKNIRNLTFAPALALARPWPGLGLALAFKPRPWLGLALALALA